MSATPLSNTSQLTEHYERLRQHAVCPRPGRAQAAGMALFLRQGMTAWMKTWAPLLSVTPAPTPAPCLAEPTWPDHDMRAQLTAIVAGFLLGQSVFAQQEVHP